MSVKWPLIGTTRVATATAHPNGSYCATYPARWIAVDSPRFGSWGELVLNLSQDFGPFGYREIGRDECLTDAASAFTG